MADRNEIRDTFFLECEELLEALDDGLREIDGLISTENQDPETVNAVFRAVHSIKGGAGAFGLEDLVEFAHGFETALDFLRSGKLVANAEMLRVFYRANDRLLDLVGAARDGEILDPAESSDVLAALETMTAEITKDMPSDTPISFEPMSLDFDFEAVVTADAPGDHTNYRIRLTPKTALYIHGNDPAHVIRALRDLGQVRVAIDPTTIPSFKDCTAGQTHITWDMNFETEEPEHVLFEVFDFVESDCVLQIEPVDAAPDAIQLASSAQDLEKEPPAEPVNPDDSAAVSLSLVPPAAKPASSVAAPKRATVRVDLERVDRLINVVGELVINQAMLAQCAENAGITSRDVFATGLEEFKQLSREIQESVMAIRAQPVKSLFQRMARIVREASASTGKSVRLVTEGEATEVDKTVVEKLADPLTHMVRNAVDHGLELTVPRQATGKPETGTVTLSAAHRSGRVIIEISDDGQGIDRDKVRQIAFEKDLIPEGAELTDSEIDNLLFLPGFSTADQVSNLSGRGVGMDVVKSAIHTLGGRVSISSVPGQGSTFTISLPLTLAVLEGMVVDVAGETMVIPLSAILETLRPGHDAVHTLGTGDQVVSIRGTIVPIVDLAAAFGLRSAETYDAARVLLLVETEGNQICALVVDRIFDQRQVVIKGLEDNYGHVAGVVAATILGDGQIALIVDPDTVFENLQPIQIAPERLYASEG